MDNYAGFWKRFIAIIIDGILISLLISVLLFLRSLVTGGAAYDPGAFSNITTFIISLAYFSYQESSEKQATIGKSIMGIKVTDLHGNRISLLNAAGRHLGKILSSAIMMIGYIIAAFTPRKQALHDMLASTLVLNK
jgi:uncharacterized RDD family membrane protein YckC